MRRKHGLRTTPPHASACADLLAQGERIIVYSLRRLFPALLGAVTSMSSKQRRDRQWFAIHSWIGLKLSVLLSFVLITGSFAVISHELDWLFTPQMRAALPAPERYAWGDAYDELRRQYPSAKVIGLSRDRDPWFALQGTVFTPWGELGRLWFDPATGAFQGSSKWLNLQRFFRTTHRHLMLPTPIGVPIVASLAIPLLLSLVTGLIVYKRFWRGFFRWPRFRRKARIWNGDVHRLLGLWSSWFLLLMVITGLWYLIESLGGRAPPFPKPASVTTSETSADAEAVSGAAIDRMIATAQSVYPGFRVRLVSLPQKAGAPLTVSGDLDAVLVRPRANVVAFDPATGELLGSYRGEELGIHTRISEAADPLHFGYFGGLWTKVIWFLFGLAMSALALTGSVIYGKRLHKHYTSREPILTTAATP